MPANLENSSGYRSVFIPIPKKGNAKEYSNYQIIALISYASKVMFKILQARLQQYMNWELPNVQTRFRKGRGTGGQIANIHWILEKTRGSPPKKSTSASLIMIKPLIVWITMNCGKFLKRWENETTWPATWEICMQVKKQQLELYKEQQTGSKSGKEYFKAVYCHPAYLTYMQSTWQPTPVFLPGEFQGQGSLLSCRLWGSTESDMTDAT